MKEHTVSIVIPNFNGKHLLEKHLAHIVDAVDKGEIIIVDDGSTDDSGKYIKDFFPKITLVSHKRQVGFAGAVNAGVKAAFGDVIILLNTDVEPQKGFLAPLLNHFTDENIFAVGCMDKSVENGQIHLRGRGIAEWKFGFLHHRRGEVDASDTAWVSGGSGAFRKDIWEKLGGMDVLYSPFYWEDIDLSYRALKAGYRILFEPKSIVNHYHEHGAIQTQFSKSFVRQIDWRNHFIFIWKNVTARNLIIEHIANIPRTIFQALKKRDVSIIGGFVKAIFLMPHIIKARRSVVQFWAIDDTSIFLAK